MSSLPNRESVVVPSHLQTTALARGIVQRACQCGNRPIAFGGCAECSKDESNLQRKGGSVVDMPVASDGVQEVLRSSGQPLDESTRAFFEPRFGHDFSRVRVHADAKAAESARSVSALAYTVGRHVVIGTGQHAPGTLAGRQLLAHELTHVMQQGQHDRGGAGTLRLGTTGDEFEREADEAARRVVDASIVDQRFVPVLQRSDSPAVMRSEIFSSTMDICRWLLRSRIFGVSQGGVSVTANATWEASPEWRGSEAPRCGRNTYNITLNRSSWPFDSEYGSCEFDMGSPSARSWGDLPSGDYYLTIWTNNTNPNCCLRGDIVVSQQSGLSGECTRPPPGPLEILHDALALAGLFPGLGAIPDAIDTGIYVIQGDWAGAGLSAAAIVPIFGDAASVGRIAARTVVRIEGRAVVRVGREGIAGGLREARAPVRAVLRSIPQGFTERQFERFSRGARRLRRSAGLPDGELVIHGSRVSGTARTASDIDVALRVDEATFFNLAESVLARARPGTRLRETMLDRIRRNGQLSSFDLGTEFQAMRRELLDAESPVIVQFSVLKRGGRLDTGPFLPLE